jgi:DNA-binding NarL/FixJ family response regulator
VVEEHEVLRYGLVACLAEDRGLDVRAANAEALAKADVDIAVVSGEAACRNRFACPIVVCSEDPKASRNRAAGNDVVGVLHRDSLTVAQLHATVYAAAAGLRVNPHDEGERLGEELDTRARRVLELMAEGHSTREIADRLSYSERTIKKLITRLEQAMQARSRPHLVAQAIRRGVI